MSGVSNTPSMRYRTIVADPPWPQVFHSAANGNGDKAAPYPTMAVEEIKALPVRQLAVTDYFGSQRAALRAKGLPTVDGSHLYLWTTQAFLWESRDVAEAWGFKPHYLLVWCKTPNGPGAGGGSFASTLEFVLFCSRGKPTGSGKVDRQWFEWPRSRHSEKPDAFYDLVEQISRPPRIELFARRNRLGWDAWGNETLSSVGYGQAGWYPINFANDLSLRS